MLLPRRKGQLVKLLILVPLSLLLITSIYYQFYYETQLAPSTQHILLPSDSSIVPMAQQQQFARHQQDNSEQLLNDDDDAIRNSAVIDVDLINNNDSDNVRRNKNNNYNNDNYYKIVNSNNNQDDDNYVIRAKSARHQQPINHDSSRQRLPDLPKRLLAHRRQPLADDALVAFTDKQLDDYNDNNGNYNSNNNNNNRSKLSDSSSDNRLDHDVQEQEDAQGAAVIPAPSEPNGPGELGRPVVLKNLTKEQQKLVNVGWENNAFNQYVSDIISLNRSLPDVRDPSCKSVQYPPASQLPPTSVIICFHNEAWSVLLRTVHSIINRSPKNLIEEIILVDDFSNKAHLGQQLEDYVKQFGPDKVKIVRATKREGLIRARLLGARVAKAPVLTFLDSHCECADGWIEPLLARIHEDRTAVVCPVIDVISDKTFEYHYKGDANSISVGGFDWNLQFNWHSIPERERKRRQKSSDPLRSPTMAGGLFSIDKQFFERLGTYDSGFDIWGGENLELSFKTWMCGGKLEILPCSHVGHVFRSRSPYKWRTGVNVLKRNSVRLAEVWMDDYKKYYYDRIGHDLGDYGDISERVELRKHLHCKPFSYFVKEIYPELFIPGEAIAYGEVRNESDDRGKIKMCLDSSARKSDYRKPLGVYPCHGSGGNQYWLLSRDGEIRRDEACVDYAGRDVVLFPCHGSGGNQLWLYDNETLLLRHSTSGRCLELASNRVKLEMSDCDPSNESQRWTFQHYNATLAAMHPLQ